MITLHRIPKTCYCARYISLSAVNLKQPPHDRQRYQRQKQPPNHSLPFFDETPSKEFPVKPKDISGQWGSTDFKLKNSGFKFGERLKKMPTQLEKLQELYHLEDNLWFHSLDHPLKYPEMYDFIRVLTRTKVLPWISDLPDCRLLSKYMNFLLSEEITDVNNFPVNPLDQSSNGKRLRSESRRNRISIIMEGAYRACINSQNDLFTDSKSYQIDDRATIETFIKRLVNKEIFQSIERISEDVYESVNETVIDSNNCVRYRIRSELAWQLRGPNLLKPFIAWDDPQCFQHESMNCDYRPELFDIKPVECYNFTCLPYSKTIDFSEFARSVAGYWSRTPFWEGDPCEFGLLGVLDIGNFENVIRDIKSTALPENVKEKIIERHSISEGLLSAFTWTSAQAYNQGFTLYNEITYPFCAQILLLDENSVQLLRYQLNSLTSLWKSEDAKLPYNLVMISPRLKLYQRVQNDSGSNSCITVNQDAMSLIASAFFYPTLKHETSALLRPYLADKSGPRDFLVGKKDKVLIPNSEDDEISNISSMNVEDSSTVGELTETEKSILKAAELAEKKCQHTRFYTAKRPHPNDVFFYKLTDRNVLIEELKDETPNFGGPFGRLPENHWNQLKKYRTQKRYNQPRLRVQEPPRRWR